MDEPIFQCQFCPLTFKARRTFYRHLQDAHPNPTTVGLPEAASVRPTNPERANSTNPERANPTNPQKASLTNPQKASLSNPQKASLTKPQKAQVKEPEAKTCKICAIEVETAELLKVHMKEHLEVQPQNFSCKDCNDKFVTKTDLTLHVKQCHSYTAAKCNKCQLKFETKQTLSEHVRNQHTPTICPKCKLHFPTRVEAKHHYYESHGKSLRDIGKSVKDKKSKMKREKNKQMSSIETKLKLKETVGDKNQEENPPKSIISRETDLGKNDLDRSQRMDISMEMMGADSGMEKLTMRDEKIENMIQSKILPDGNWPKVCLRRLDVFPGTLMPSTASVGQNQKNLSHSKDEQKPRERKRGSSSSDCGSESKQSRSERNFELPDIDDDDDDEQPDHDIRNNNLGSTSQQQSTPNLIEEFMRHDVCKSQTPQAVTDSSTPISRDNPGAIVSKSSSSESCTQVMKDAPFPRTQRINPDMAEACKPNAKSPVLRLAQHSSSLLIPDSRNIATSNVVVVGHEISSSQIFFNQISQCASEDLGSSLSSMDSCARSSSPLTPNNHERDLHEKLNDLPTGSEANGLMTVIESRSQMEVTTNDLRTECARHPPVSDSTPCMDNQNNSATANGVKKSNSLAEEKDDNQANNNQDSTTISLHSLSKNETSKSFSSNTSSRQSTTADRNSDTDAARSSRKTVRQNMFKFRTLANKLISHIGKLQLLLNNRYSADKMIMKQIYSNFDAVTAQWEKIETFIETISESEQESEYLDELMDEAEKLSDSVTKISRDVLAVPEDMAYAEKTCSELREMHVGFKEELNKNK